MRATTRVESAMGLLTVLLCGWAIIQPVKATEAPDLTGADEPEWTSYVSEAGGYQVEMPGKPEEMTQMVPTELGDVEMLMAIHEVSDTEVYMAAHTDFPGDPVTAEADVKEVLRKTREGMMSGPGAKLLGETEIELDGNPGLEFDAKLASILRQKARIFYVGNRLYQVLSIYPEGASNEAKAQRFVESFQLSD